MAARYSSDLARHVRDYLISKREKVPSIEVFEKLFETLFFASLRREETQAISCRVAFIDRKRPDPRPPQRRVADRWGFFPLSTDLPFTVSNLVKLSQAVDPWGSTLAADADSKGKLRIWGLIDQSVHFSTYLVKEASVGPEMPGMFQAAIDGVGEVSVYKTYVLIGSLKYDTLIKRQHRVFQAGPIHSKMMPWVEAYRTRVVKKANKEAYESRDHWDDSLEDLWFSVLCRLLIGIQRYGHGGAVLISDNGKGLVPKYSLKYPRLSDALVRAVVHDIEKTFYSDSIFENYTDQDIDEMPISLYLDEAVSENDLVETNNELKGCIRFLTSLSRVDGLLWLNTDLSLQAFGVEIALSSSDDRNAIRVQMEASLGNWLNGNASYDQRVVEIVNVSRSHSGFKQKGGSGTPPTFGSAEAVHQYIQQFATELQDRNKAGTYALELGSYLDLKGAPAPPDWVLTRLQIKDLVAQRLNEVGQMNANLNMGEDQASEFDPTTLAAFEVAVTQKNAMRDEVEKLWKKCLIKGVEGDQACTELQSKIGDSWMVENPLRPNFLFVNPMKPDTVYLGAIPAGKSVRVVTRGTFNLWGGHSPGVTNDPEHGGGLFIKADADTGENVHSNWYTAPLQLSGTFQGRDVAVKVYATPQDPYFPDNCCNDFRMALVPIK
jgi:hypothetical protein